MLVSLIVAVAKNGVIGIDNKLPWHLPNDLKYFKQVTMGKPIIMGRKTYESIGRPLPGRTNIVISRQEGYSAEGCKTASSLQEAVGLAKDIAVTDGADEVVVIGGAQIYIEAMSMADRLYLTEVHAEVEGDAFFPDRTETDWTEVGREDHMAEGPNPYDYSFVVYESSRKA